MGAPVVPSPSCPDASSPQHQAVPSPIRAWVSERAWSPDAIVGHLRRIDAGQHVGLIAFSAPIAGGEPGGALSDVWVVSPDGTGPRRVTDVAASGGTAVQPTFTPDGASIIFKLTDARVGASDAIATVAVDGGDSQSATGSDYLYGWHPRLRPIP